jgi:hypothetical protein
LEGFFRNVFLNPETGEYDLTPYRGIPSDTLVKSGGKRAGEPRDLGLRGFFNLFPGKGIRTVFVDDPKTRGKRRAIQSIDYFSKYVVSDIRGVRYQQPLEAPVCNMNQGQDNLLTTIRSLMGAEGDPSWDVGSVGVGASAGSGVETAVSGATRAHKWDKVCRLFDRPGFRLDWEPVRWDRIQKKVTSASGELPKSSINKEEFANIQLSINGKPRLLWLIMPKHYELVSLNKEEDWRKDLAHHTDPARRFWKSDLRSNDGKISAIEELLTHGQRGIMRRESPYLFLIDQLIETLPKDDLATQQKLLITLADHNYPFPDEVHPLRIDEGTLTPIEEVSYRRVKSEELALLFGEVAARRMGRTWSRPMHGRWIAIGEPLIYEGGSNRGKEVKAKFEDANLACLDLNPPDIRALVEAALKARESLLNLARKAGKTGEELAQIHVENPINGCYAMSKEEITFLEGDFYGPLGSQAQILPNLTDRWFWSSSHDPSNARTAFKFGGYDTTVGSSDPDYKESVRCACGAAVWKIQ